MEENTAEVESEVTIDNVMRNIYTACDVECKDSVPVSRLVEYITPFMEANLSRLLELKSALDPDEKNPEVTSDLFFKVMVEWSSKFNEGSNSFHNISSGQLGQIEDKALPFVQSTPRASFGNKIIKGCIEAGILNASIASNQSFVDNGQGPQSMEKTFYEEQIKELVYQNRKYSDELLHMKLQLVSNEEQNENLQGDLEALKRQLLHEREVVEELQKERNDCEELKDATANAQKQMERAEKHLQVAEKENAHLKTKLGKLEEEKQKYEERIVNMHKKLSENVTLLFSLQSEIKVKDEEVAQLEDVNNNLMQQLNDQNMVIQDYQDSARCVQLEKESLRDKLKKLNKASLHHSKSFSDDSPPSICVREKSISPRKIPPKQEPILVSPNVSGLSSINDSSDDEFFMRMQTSNSHHSPHESLRAEMSKVIPIQNDSSRSSDVIQLEAEKFDLENHIKQLAENIETAQKQIADLTHQLKSLQSEKAKLLESNEEHRSKLRLSDENLEKLRADVEMQIGKKDGELEQLKREKTTLEAEIKTYLKIKNNLEEKNIEYSESLANLQEENSVLKQNIDYLREENADLLEDNKNLNVHLRDQLDTLAIKEEKFEEENREMEKNVQELQSKIESNNLEEIKVLQSKLAELLDERDMIVRDKEDLEKQKFELENVVRAIAEKMSCLERSMDQKDETIAALRVSQSDHAFDDLKAELKQLKDFEREKSNIIEELEKLKDHKDKIIERLEMELETEKEKALLDDQHEIIESLRQQLLDAQKVQNNTKNALVVLSEEFLESDKLKSALSKDTDTHGTITCLLEELTKALRKQRAEGRAFAAGHAELLGSVGDLESKQLHLSHANEGLLRDLEEKDGAIRCLKEELQGTISSSAVELEGVKLAKEGLQQDLEEKDSALRCLKEEFDELKEKEHAGRNSMDALRRTIDELQGKYSDENVARLSLEEKHRAITCTVVELQMEIKERRAEQAQICDEEIANLQKSASASDKPKRSEDRTKRPNHDKMRMKLDKQVEKIDYLEEQLKVARSSKQELEEEFKTVQKLLLIGSRATETNEVDVDQVNSDLVELKRILRRASHNFVEQWRHNLEKISAMDDVLERVDGEDSPKLFRSCNRPLSKELFQLRTEIVFSCKILDELAGVSMPGMLVNGNQVEFVSSCGSSLSKLRKFSLKPPTLILRPISPDSPNLELNRPAVPRMLPTRAVIKADIKSMSPDSGGVDTVTASCAGSDDVTTESSFISGSISIDEFKASGSECSDTNTSIYEDAAVGLIPSPLTHFEHIHEDVTDTDLTEEELEVRYTAFVEEFTTGNLTIRQRLEGNCQQVRQSEVDLYAAMDGILSLLNTHALRESVQHGGILVQHLVATVRQMCRLVEQFGALKRESRLVSSIGTMITYTRSLNTRLENATRSLCRYTNRRIETASPERQICTTSPSTTINHRRSSRIFTRKTFCMFLTPIITVTIGIYFLIIWGLAHHSHGYPLNHIKWEELFSGLIKKEYRDGPPPI